MKGVLLAGGMGTRLLPLTKVLNKHLLPVWNKPMIYYPIEFLRDSGVTDIMVTLGGNDTGHMIELLGDGSEMGVNLTYRYQSSPDGIAGALRLANSFAGHDMVAVCLGDNYFELPVKLNKCKDGATIYLHATSSPEKFGIAEFNEYGELSRIVEKPKATVSNWAVTGLYVYDSYLWEFLPSLEKSARGEYEITDINNRYLKYGYLNHEFVNGYWSDMGSIESLNKVSNYISNGFKE